MTGIGIKGMSCARCAATAKKVFEEIRGISNVSVDLKKGKRFSKKITRCPGNCCVRKSQVRGTGLIKERLYLQGMTCAACVRRVENALKAMPDVVDASVNLATFTTTVVHQPGTVDRSVVEDVPRKSGYEYLGAAGSAEMDPVEEARRTEQKDPGLKVGIGGVLSVLIMMGSMIDWFPFPGLISPEIMPWLLAFLVFPVVFWAGARFFKGAVAAARHKTSDAPSTVLAAQTKKRYCRGGWLFLRESLWGVRSGATPPCFPAPGRCRP
ncbi:MAG: hypothetical protein AVO39_10440 [delta proteobacterium MLS_D]|jgi:P-type Cu+ transporter|nr:MAG: hypothetical protein AVO39_10440 [delta proteobacterium MLS_D]